MSNIHTQTTPPTPRYLSQAYPVVQSLAQIQSQPTASVVAFGALEESLLANAEVERRKGEQDSANLISSLTRWGIGLQSGDHTGLGNLVGAAVLHVHGGQEEHVALLGDPRSNGLHDLAIDGLFVVGNQVLVQELLDLVGGEPGKKGQHTITTPWDGKSHTSSRYPE